MYNRLPEDEPSGSKHIEDTVKFYVSLTKVHFVGLHYTTTEISLNILWPIRRTFSPRKNVT